MMQTSLGPVECSIAGKGLPVLFLHGGHSNCREILFQKGFDQEQFLLITPSRPGYGRTPLNGFTTPEKTAELMIALLDSLQIQRVTVYGISAAGPAAIAMAANYPDRVESLILASAVTKKWLAPGDQDYRRAQKLFNHRTERWVWGMIRIFCRLAPNRLAGKFFPQFSKRRDYVPPKDDNRLLTESLMLYRSGTGFLTDIGHRVDDSLLRNIQCPVLILHSINDNSVPFEHAEYARQLIPHSETAAIDNAWGHMLWIGQGSDEAIRQTLGFIHRRKHGKGS